MIAHSAIGAPARGQASSFIDLTREPGVRVGLASGWRISRTEDGASFAMENEYGILPPFADWSPGFEVANERVRHGAPLGALRDTVIESGGTERAAAYLIMLQLLCRRGFLAFGLADNAGPYATLEPLREDFVPTLPSLPAASDPLHRFALLRRDGGAWLLESPLCAARLRFDDIQALDRPLARRALAGAGFLQSAGEGRNARQLEALRQWDFHDLLFHCRSRNGWHRDPFGGLYPYIGEIEPPPAIRPRWPGEAIPLPRAPAGADEPFARVLERRRSEREYDESRPISLADLGALLDRCAASRSSSTNPVYNLLGQSAPFETSTRPYPNGGASYELEIYPVVDRSSDLPSGCYHYDAGAHELVRICGRTSDVEEVLQEASVATMGMARPQVVFVIAARFARVMWKYKAIAYSVILRNTGALYQTLYLAATELGLSPCGLGSGNSVVFARMTGLDPWVEGSVGDFILGGPPSRE